MIINFTLILILAFTTNELFNAVNSKESEKSSEKNKTEPVGRNKSLPTFPELQDDEKREIFHYQQTIVVIDTGIEDNKARRCEVVEADNREEQEKALSAFVEMLNLDVKEVLMDKMMDLIKQCQSTDGDIEAEEDEVEAGLNNTDSSGKENPLLNGILPGTKWCGKGDIATDYNDLGKIRNTDKCCRSHDLCPITIQTHVTRYNLTNNGISSRTHCRCDEDLFFCLKKVNGIAAKLVGTLFFNSLTQPKCITGVPEHPEEKMKFIKDPWRW